MEWTSCKHNAPRRVNHAAAVVEDKIFSFGGYVSGQDFKDICAPIEVWMFNTHTWQWKEVTSDSNAPFRRYGHSVVAFRELIYLWGGRNDVVCDGELYCFDTTSLEWSIPEVTGDKPLAADGHTAAITGDTMYVHGGYTESTAQFTLMMHSINLNTMVWTEVPLKGEYPLYRDFHSMSVHPDGHLVVFGGRELATPYYGGVEVERYPSDLYLYDLSRKRWTKFTDIKGEIPPGRRSHSQFVYGNKLFLFGGYQTNPSRHFNDMYSFDFFTQTWVRYKHPTVRPSPRRRMALCLINDVAYMFGGTHPDPDKEHVQHVRDSQDLTELNDFWTLELVPRLESLCLLKIARSNVNTSTLAPVLRELAALVPTKEYKTDEDDEVRVTRHS